LLKEEIRLKIRGVAICLLRVKRPTNKVFLLQALVLKAVKNLWLSE
jgi:hypothetical protein